MGVKNMEKNSISLELLPQPKLMPEDIALLTEKRQEIIVNLALEGKTLSRLSEIVNLQPSSIFESLELLEKKHFVKKDENKVYSLTTKGKMLAFFLLKPNGIDEKQIQELFDKFLKEEMKIEDPDQRKDMVEQRIIEFYS